MKVKATAGALSKCKLRTEYVYVDARVNRRKYASILPEGIRSRLHSNLAQSGRLRLSVAGICSFSFGQ